MTVLSTHDVPLPVDTEARLADFTDLVATALADAESQAALTASRARIVAAADATRRRIERDLHDGAQQRLVSLALHLRSTVRSALPPGARELTDRLDAVGTELTGVLDDLREFARGLHPSALADGGLRPALKALARRSAVPVRLEVRVDRRLPDPIELAAYYTVAETLTNSVIHASSGGADPRRGSGLVALTDRVEALGGRLALLSPRGGGTTVGISLPLPAAQGPGSPAEVT
jgi:signal transduction histidine kinase